MAVSSNRTVPRGVVSSAGNEAFDACRNGNLVLIKKLINATNANLKDKSGRKSSPLHFAAGTANLLQFTVLQITNVIMSCSGFGRKNVVEYLIQCVADVQATDDGMSLI